MARAISSRILLNPHIGRSLSIWSRVQDALGVDAPSTSYKEATDVVVIDPRAVLEGRAGDVKSVTVRGVPPALVLRLSQGVNELGDMDDPMDEWIFGERAEIFEYKCVGVSGTKSGYTSLITADALEKAQGGSTGLPPWEDFRAQLAEGTVKFPSKKHPFLFAGESRHIVESAEAAVYELARDGQTVGLLVSSETADGGDD